MDSPSSIIAGHHVLVTIIGQSSNFGRGTHHVGSGEATEPVLSNHADQRRSDIAMDRAKMQFIEGQDELVAALHDASLLDARGRVLVSVRSRYPRPWRQCMRLGHPAGTVSPAGHPGGSGCLHYPSADSDAR